VVGWLCTFVDKWHVDLRIIFGGLAPGEALNTPHKSRNMAHAVASMSAVASAAAPRFNSAKSSGVKSTLAQRTAARKTASQAAFRVNASSFIVAEEIEAGTEKASMYEAFKTLLGDYSFDYKVGDKISGKCFHCDAKGAWVDIGAKAAALCPASEASLADVKKYVTHKSGTSKQKMHSR
jgi:hypothetical protein